MKKLFVILFVLSACADSPKEFLRKRGRPSPYSCIAHGEDNRVCTDGGGVTWLCEYRMVGADNECVIMNMLNPPSEK